MEFFKSKGIIPLLVISLFFSSFVYAQSSNYMEDAFSLQDRRQSEISAQDWYNCDTSANTVLNRYDYDNAKKSCWQFKACLNFATAAFPFAEYKNAALHCTNTYSQSRSETVNSYFDAVGECVDSSTGYFTRKKHTKKRNDSDKELPYRKTIVHLKNNAFWAFKARLADATTVTPLDQIEVMNRHDGKIYMYTYIPTSDDWDYTDEYWTSPGVNDVYEGNVLVTPLFTVGTNRSLVVDFGVDGSGGGTKLKRENNILSEIIVEATCLATN